MKSDLSDSSTSPSFHSISNRIPCTRSCLQLESWQEWRNMKCFTGSELRPLGQSSQKETDKERAQLRVEKLPLLKKITDAPLHVFFFYLVDVRLDTERSAVFEYAFFTLSCSSNNVLIYTFLGKCLNKWQLPCDLICFLRWHLICHKKTDLCTKWLT